MIVPARLAQSCARISNVEILNLPIAVPRFHIAQYWHNRYHTESGCEWLRGLVNRLFGTHGAHAAIPVRVGATG
jgi:hypothetical protein